MNYTKLILSASAFCLVTMSGEARNETSLPIRRIEPMNWWVGMKEPVVQLVVYGENIAAWRPEIVYPGVTVSKVVTTENPNYLFLYLNIAPETQSGEVPVTFTNGRKKITSNYPLLAREAGSAERKGFDSSDAMYLLMPDRFANGNPDNDSHPQMKEKVNRADMNGRHGGDIQGVINQLDYLQDLGFTALWSTPMMEDNLPVYSYHTYAISDFYNIDPRYGTREDYKRLASEAKKRGIKLVMDVVTNHAATEHYMVKDRPTKDWIHPKERCNFRVWTVQDPYAAQADKNLNSQGWFDDTMADLNQNNPLFMDYLTQNAIWWIEYAGLSGLRIDTYPYNYPQAMSRFNKQVLGEYPNLNIVGEVWMHEPMEVAYWQKDARNIDGFNSGLPAVMDFPLNDALNLFTREKQGWEDGIMRIYKNFTRDYLYPDPDNILIFADNHDTQRLWKQIDGKIPDFKLIFTLLSTVRGIPQVYYGTEIMMTGVKEVGDGDIRRDFPGGWPGDPVNAFTAEGRTAEQNEVFNYMRTLLNWRKQNPVIHSGKMMHYVPQDEVYVYFRYNDDKKVMVVLNNSDTDAKTLQLDRYGEMLKGVSGGKDVVSGKRYPLADTLTVPAKSSLILEVI
ncbi:MAG: glycoside hydrolase family 13 protein [Bacteroidales bacterium]